jgi:hypothetical protein
VFSVTLPVTFATLAAGNQPLSLFDTEFAAIAALGMIPCAASAGPNSIALTPFAGMAPVVTSYPDLGPGFVFAAAATSTGAVTLNVSGVGARNGYKWNGTQALGNGDIISGNIYKATPLQALNAGSGGFVVDTIGTANNVSDIEFVIDGGGSAILVGNKGWLHIPWNATVTAWRVMADQSGSIVIDILNAGNAFPVASMVGAGNKPTLTAAQFAQTTPIGWSTTTLLQDQWIAFNVTSATTVTKVTVVLTVAKS